MGIRVVADIVNLHRSELGSVTCGLWVADDSAAFPERGWTDFPVIVLGWWLEECVGLLRVGSKSGRCRFMDGPLSLKVVAMDGGECRVECMDARQSPPRVTKTFRGDLRMFLHSMAGEAAKVRLVCVDHGWGGTEIEALGRLTAEMQGALRETLK